MKTFKNILSSSLFIPLAVRFCSWHKGARRRQLSHFSIPKSLSPSLPPFFFFQTLSSFPKGNSEQPARRVSQACLDGSEAVSRRFQTLYLGSCSVPQGNLL